MREMSDGKRHVRMSEVSESRIFFEAELWGVALGQVEGVTTVSIWNQFTHSTSPWELIAPLEAALGEEL
jgi:hypothetical protein